MIAPALSAFCILSKLTGICVRFFAEGGGAVLFITRLWGARVLWKRNMSWWLIREVGMMSC